MQYNIAEHSMETFLEILFILLLFLSVSMNLFMSNKINKLESLYESFIDENLEELYVNIDEIMIKTVKISEQLESFHNETCRSLMALRETLETTKPIKPNNWDSIKEAFKAPLRTEVNERN
jgi:hypothetical protein